VVKSTSRNAQKKNSLSPGVDQALSQSSVRAIFLVGFMGAGKSSVGRALGENLNCAFEDLDDRIERMEGRSIAEIFRTSGEAEFRRIEREALRQILQELTGEIKVVGLGGGAFVQSENAELLKSAGVVTVFLDAPVDELWQRCTKQAEEQGLSRPLLQSAEHFGLLCEQRRSSYVKASLRVETGSRTVTAIAREIADALKNKKLGREKEGLPL
jgi:shikimate kinase